MAPPDNQWFQKRDISRVNWNRLFYDDKSKLLVVTSIHTKDPISNPDKIVAMYKVGDKEWLKKMRKMFNQFERQKIDLSDPTSFVL